jgi:hypothetical protein
MSIEPSTGEVTAYCKRCDTTKPLDDFHIDRTRPNGHVFYCKPCLLERHYAYRDSKVDEYRAQRRRASYKHLLRTKFGLTIEQYEEMLAAQGGVCAICKRPERSISKHGSVKVLAVDHDHKTGAVRKLLCNECNKGLGSFQDDLPRMLAAVEYLRQFQGSDSDQSQLRQ